jgi:hypothetical protein
MATRAEVRGLLLKSILIEIKVARRAKGSKRKKDVKEASSAKDDMVGVGWGPLSYT